VDGLQANFGDRINFYHIDTDDARQLQTGRKFGLFRHTQYILVDGEGEVLGEWNGYLNQEEVAIALDAVLMSNNQPSR
jgi:hypothetical protein